MPPLDSDDDLFDPPKAKPSNKIVFQPAGAQWSLDRLPEVESLYQSTFKKRLPLTNRGQGSIHNKWGYDHRNSADVSINPSTPEGQQFIEGLKKANVPFLAFSSAIPGVATGPHVHIGFPSKRTQQKFNVGAQKKSKSVASDDLFDTDDDLFDQNSEQNLPAVQSTRISATQTPPVSPKQSKAPSAPIRSRSGGIFGRPEVRRAVEAQRQPAITGSSNIGELLRADEPEVKRIQRFQREEDARATGAPTLDYMGTDPRRRQSRVAQIAARRASEERAAEEQRQREAPDLDRLTQEYRQQIREAARITPNYGPTQWFQEALHKGEAGLLELGAAGARAFTGASRNPEYTKQVADKMRLHAEAMQRAAIEEGADRNVVSQTLQDATAGLISTAPELAAMSLGAPPIATFAAGGGARAYGRGGGVREVAKEAAHGAATGAIFELPVPGRIQSPVGRVAAKAGTVGAATTGMELATGTPAKEAVASGLTNAALAGYGELKHGGRRGTQTETKQGVEAQRAPVESEPAVAEVDRSRMAGTPPEMEVVTSDARAADIAVPETTAQPQRFYHKDWGEVVRDEDQTGARKGRTKVYEEADPTKVHYPKTADLRGRGNERMVPVRSAERPETETLLRDDAGEPLTLYHHTTKEAKEAILRTGFDLSKGRARLSDEAVPDGVFFTPSDKTPFRDPNIEFARIDANLAAKNPLRVENRDEIRQWASERDAEYATITKDLSKYTYEEMGRLYEELEGNDKSAAQRAEQELQSLNGKATRGRAILTNLLKRDGYDSLIMERDEAGPQVTKTYVVLDPKQVRIKREADTSVGPPGPSTPASKTGSGTIAPIPETVPPVRETKPPESGTVGAVSETALNPTIKQAFADWRDRRAYIDGNGNYHVKTEGRSFGPIAPWNKEVRQAFKTVGDFHAAANQAESTVDRQASVPDQRELIRQKRPGEGGFAAVSKPAKTVGPVLKEAQRAVQLEPTPVSKRIFAGIKRLPTTLQTALVSEFTPLRKLEEAVRGKDVAVDMARKFEQVAGAPAKAEADFIDFKRAVVDPIRQSADDFNAYLFLKRVEDRLSKDPERKKVASWTVEKAQQGLKELEESVGADTMARFREVGKVYQDEMNRALQLQVDSGRMSQELYDKIVNSNDFYAPFKVLKYIEQSEHGGGRNIATTQQLTKKISGIESEDFQVGNILQSSAEQIMRSRVLAEKKPEDAGTRKAG